MHRPIRTRQSTCLIPNNHAHVKCDQRARPRERFPAGGRSRCRVPHCLRYTSPGPKPGALPVSSNHQGTSGTTTSLSRFSQATGRTENELRFVQDLLSALSLGLHGSTPAALPCSLEPALHCRRLYQCKQQCAGLSLPASLVARVALGWGNGWQPLLIGCRSGAQIRATSGHCGSGVPMTNASAGA